MKKLVKKLDIDTQSGIIYIALGLLWILFSILTKGNFLSPRNLSNVSRVVSTTGILACSTVLIIVSGGIDLSAGYVAMFAGCTVAALMTKLNVPVVPAILITLVMGMIIGFVNGFIVAYTGLAPFIVTLATQMVYYGLAFLVTNGGTIAPLPKSFNYMGQSYINKSLGYILAGILIIYLLFSSIRSRKEKMKYGFDIDSNTVLLIKWFITSLLILLFIFIMNSYQGLPIPVLVMIVVLMLLSFMEKNTTWGRSIFAIGGNREAAHYSGIKVKRNWVIVFVLQSTMAAISGMLLAAKVNSGSMQTGINLHLDSIAAAVIGGTSMSGGVGRVPGAILGAVFMSTIDNGMSMLNVNVAWQFIVKGVVLAAAVIFDALSKKNNK